MFSDKNVDNKASNSDINYDIATYFVILDRLKNSYDRLFEKYSFFFQLEKLNITEIREQAKCILDIGIHSIPGSLR